VSWVRVVAVALEDSGKFAIFRRAPGQRGAGQWEFPGGKVELGEDLLSALRREIREELSVEIEIQRSLGTHRHDYGDKKIELHVFVATIVAGEIKLSEHDAYQWLFPQEFKPDEMSEADRPFISLL